jgi:hypothetical protein
VHGEEHGELAARRLERRDEPVQGRDVIDIRRPVQAHDGVGLQREPERLPRVARLDRRPQHLVGIDHDVADEIDLFDPDDGYYEYSAVTSNLEHTLVNLWHFMAGRGAHEKTNAQLKSGLAFRTVPTLAYAANSARLATVRTLHFTLFHRAALLLRPAARSILRLAKNPATEDLFMHIALELPCAA